VQRYIVESGDTLKSIANQFDVSVEAILRFNGLSEEDGDNLRVGQELFIPPQ
jgi:LysM repeat protein